MNSLNTLNKIIESINTNITDDNITDFQNELSQLGAMYKNNQAATYFLKMFKALAKYLDSKKKRVHADTIPVLISIASDFEKLMDNPELTKNQINEILLKTNLEYKALKNKIASRPEIHDNEINDLKAVILAIDWEISETTLENFENVITTLLSKLKFYNIHYAFLKIIHSIVIYIGAQQANAHIDSISFLQSVFKNFEQIVQHTGMSYEEKKLILETDIKKFQAFKNKISQGNKKNQTPDEISTDNISTDNISTDNISTDSTSEDDSIIPALSQFKQNSMSDDDNDSSLTTLSKVEELTPIIQTDPDVVEPSSANSQDIMDDLFNAKESPADELLDAIHLLNVHGENPDQAMDMLDTAEDLQNDGMKNFTPQTKTNEPIPEIGDRLDAFFNLEAPESAGIPNDKAVQTLKIDEEISDNEGSVEIETSEPGDSEPYESTLDGSEIDGSTIDNSEIDDSEIGIVPFQDKDESFEEIAKQYDDSLKKLIKLKSFFENQDWLTNASLLLSIDQHITNLKEHWKNDPEKSGLLQIITMNINLLKTRYKNVNQSGDNQTSDGIPDKNFEDASAPQVETTGIWGRIKKKFTP